MFWLSNCVVDFESLGLEGDKEGLDADLTLTSFLLERKIKSSLRQRFSQRGGERASPKDSMEEETLVMQSLRL